MTKNPSYTPRKWFNSRAAHPAKMAAVALAGLVAATPLAAAEATAQQPTIRSHALTVFGEPKYPRDFRHFEYVNPGAPKGGDLKTFVIGSFDSVNMFIFKGESARGLEYVHDTLMTRSSDEPSTSYGLLAREVEYPEDKSWIVFHLRPEARWHDGAPVTADDVVWSFNTLKKDGHPTYGIMFRDVGSVEKIDEHTVKFKFSTPGNRQLIMLMGDLPVLPKHYWEKAGKPFAETASIPPLGSGPYRVKDFNNGRHIIFERVPDWWGRDLPVNKGRYNFDRLRYDFYRDESTGFGSLGTGASNFFEENTAKRWAVGYSNIRAVQDGEIVKEHIRNDTPKGLQGFMLNSRREQFQDVRVRKAISILFNFEWGNKMVAYGAYERTNSYFENSEMESSGLPQGRELEILEQYRGKIPDEVFTKEFKLPRIGNRSVYDAEREMLKEAYDLLKEAGYDVKNGKMTNLKTGKPLAFEFLLYGNGFDAWIAPYIGTMKRLGIDATLRVVDTSQYTRRLQQFDYDLIVDYFPQAPVPGTELRNYWNSRSADQAGSRNTPGIRNPVVDELIEKVVEADTKEELTAASKALDRVLLHNHYVIPHFHIKYFRVAHDGDMKKPAREILPQYDLRAYDTWWYGPEAPRPPGP